MYSAPNAIVIFGILTFFIALFAILACYIAYKRVILKRRNRSTANVTPNFGLRRPPGTGITSITVTSTSTHDYGYGGRTNYNYNEESQYSEEITMDMDKSPPPPEFFEALTYPVPVLSTNCQEEDLYLPSYQDCLKQASFQDKP